MSRRTVAGLLAFGLVVVLSIGAALVDVPYVRFRPGPTFDTLHSAYGKQLVVIKGHKVYRDDGELRMITIIPDGPTDHLSLITVMAAWIDPNDAVLPYDALYKKSQTSAQVQQESAAQMSSSQDAATAAALKALKIPFSTEVSIPIVKVDKGGAADGVLKVGDLLVAVDGKKATSTSGFITLIRKAEPGARLPLTVVRGGKRTTVTVITRADAAKPTESKINISVGSAVLKLKTPFKIEFQLADRIGGPSAGMMFALSIYDLLTPGSLTGGKVVAGTGEISPDGIVGPIGGIGQKMVAAQRDHAQLFLAPAENCAEAGRAQYDKSKMRLVKVRTLTDAIDAVEAWRKNPDAALPRCSG